MDEPIHSTLPDDPDFQVIVREFIESLHGRIIEMNAHQRADCERLAELAHWLKGVGATVGFPCFTEPASQLDRLAKQDDLAAIRATLAQIASLADRLAIS